MRYLCTFFGYLIGMDLVLDTNIYKVFDFETLTAWCVIFYPFSSSTMLRLHSSIGIS